MSLKISIICPYNDDKKLQILLSSLTKQTYKYYETILVDSKINRFESAAQALNYGCEKAKGDIFLFCHQDIELLEDSALEKVAYYCEHYKFGIGGVAGATSKNNHIYSKVVDGPERIQSGLEIDSPVEVETIDECLFFIPRYAFKGFDYIGKTWHFYSVDYSLSCLERDEKVLVFPIAVYHLSNGFSMNKNYFDFLPIVGKKHKAIKFFKTTMLTVNNNCFLRLRCRLIYFKYLVRKITHSK